jgi:DNA-binding transcriptional LysR family regulator
MELRHLRYFIAVAEEGQVTRAAARLGIQQPPLTLQIQALERELGVQLFSRSPRRIDLNAAGRMFLGEARRVVAAADEAVLRVRQFNLGVDGGLRVGLTSSSLMHARTRALIDRFRRDYPHISLKIDEGAAYDLLQQVENEQLDVAFIRAGADRHGKLATQWLSEEKLIVAMPAQHAMARAESVSLADLQKSNVILYRQDKCQGIGEMLLERCGRAGIALRIVDETRRLMSAVNMVAAGIGVTVVPDSVRSFQLDAVVYRPLAGDRSLKAPLNMVYRRQAQGEPLRRFLELGAEIARQEAPTTHPARADMEFAHFAEMQRTQQTQHASAIPRPM